jgi:hypothetical protein
MRSFFIGFSYKKSMNCSSGCMAQLIGFPKGAMIQTFVEEIERKSPGEW